MYRFAIIPLAALASVTIIAQRPARADDATCAGTITNIEGEKLIVKAPDNQEHQLWVVPATRIMLDGKSAKPNDLKIGQQVKCRCSKEGDKLTCSMIEATSRAP